MKPLPMGAPIFAIDAVHPQPRILQKAVEALGRGELLAYPTDTYYGLGCDLSSRRSIDRLHLLKGHDRKRPMSILVPDLSEVARYAKVSNFAYRVIRHLTPGPFTFVLEATRLVPEVMRTKQKTVGIRVPDSAVARGLSLGLGRPLVTTSAQQGDRALVGADDIQDVFGHGLGLILDGGPQPLEPSTMLSLIGDAVELLRQGKGDASDVLAGA
jgi:tRNA threonylcarbamoyl adenosine modification protein (Sua5/YciO/YrdC/YwlC family)